MVLWLTAWHTVPALITLAALATVNLSVPNTATEGKYKAQVCNNRKPQFSQIVQKPAQLVGSGDNSLLYIVFPNLNVAIITIQALWIFL